MRSLPAKRGLRGFTIVELLIVVAVTSILIALLLPAVQTARERARSVQCRNNLLQIGVALQHYNMTHRMLPPGCVNATAPVTSVDPGYGLSWTVQILPFMGETATYRQIDFGDPRWSFFSAEQRAELLTAIAERDAQTADQDGSHDTSMNAFDGRPDSSRGLGPGDPTDRVYPPVWFICPSGPASRQLRQSYAGCHHSIEKSIDGQSDGLLYLNSSIQLESIPDGAAYTLLVGEHSAPAVGRGWMFGDRSTLRNGRAFDNVSQSITVFAQDTTNERQENTSIASADDRQADLRRRQLLVGPFGSLHSYSVHFSVADGSVVGLSKHMSLEVLQQLISRYDSLPITDPF
jgi:prepilin-type N-terminal cleavage/methylation domain-containing protein